MIPSLEKYTFGSSDSKLLSTQTFLNGNSVGYTAELLNMLWNDIPLDDFKAYLSGIKRAQIVPGLYGRGQGSRDQVGGEDLWAIAALFASMPSEQRISAYLDKTLCTYDIHKPEQVSLIDLRYFEWKKPWNVFKHWLGRFPALIAHIKMCENRPLNIYYATLWAWASDATIKSRHQDGLMHFYQSHIAFSLKKPQSEIMQAAHNRWKLANIDMPAVYAAYIGDPDHPLVYAAKRSQAKVGF